jgi:hypothetical protein
MHEGFKRELMAVTGFTEKELWKFDLSKLIDEAFYEVMKQGLLSSF